VRIGRCVRLVASRVSIHGLPRRHSSFLPQQPVLFCSQLRARSAAGSSLASGASLLMSTGLPPSPQQFPHRRSLTDSCGYIFFLPAFTRRALFFDRTRVFQPCGWSAAGPQLVPVCGVNTPKTIDCRDGRFASCDHAVARTDLQQTHPLPAGEEETLSPASPGDGHARGSRVRCPVPRVGRVSVAQVLAMGLDPARTVAGSGDSCSTSHRWTVGTCPRANFTASLLTTIHLRRRPSRAHKITSVPPFPLPVGQSSTSI